jgi:hypothetical protein
MIAPGPIEPVISSRPPHARPAGALLGTIAAITAVGGAAMAAYASYDLFARDLAARDVVGKVRKLRGAGESWARVNYTSVLQQAGNSPIELPLAELIAVGLLPADFDPTDSYGQRYAVLVRKSLVPSPLSAVAKKLVEGQLEILVAGTGGRPMQDARARYTATVLGGGAAVTRDDPTMLRGAYNSWSTPVSSWATAVLPAPQPGSVASLLVLHPGELQMAYLHRFRLPGSDVEANNAMGMPIVFAAGGIRDVGRLGLKNLTFETSPALFGSMIGALPYHGCTEAVLPSLPIVEVGTVIRATNTTLPVPMSCAVSDATPVPKWVPWQVIGAPGGLPWACPPGQALKSTGAGWTCGTLVPFCPSTGVPQSPCPPTSPPCVDIGWQCYGEEYRYYSCVTGWIRGNDNYCAPPPPTSCPDGSTVPYNANCPLPASGPTFPQYMWGDCNTTSCAAYENDGGGWYCTSACLPPTGSSCPGQCWPRCGTSESGITCPDGGPYLTCVPLTPACSGACNAPC